MEDWKNKIESFDLRRDIIIPGNFEETIKFCAHQFLELARDAIKKKGAFTVALSGGKTPNAIFQEIGKINHLQSIDWSKVLCFWSDERAVPPTDSQSNYFNAMESGLSKLPLVQENIFRMKAESDIEDNALAYEKLIREKVPSLEFDLMMLGMGEDGHTASLFPRTHALHTNDRLVVANYVPQKHTWRMTLTYECINRAKNICIYALGVEKAATVAKIFLSAYDPDNLPIQKIGTPSHKACWMLDTQASDQFVRSMKTQITP